MVSSGSFGVGLHGVHAHDICAVAGREDLLVVLEDDQVELLQSAVGGVGVHDLDVAALDGLVAQAGLR